MKQQSNLPNFEATSQISRTAPGGFFRSLSKSVLALSVFVGLSIAATTTASAAVLAGWDVHALAGGANSFGASPLTTSTADTNLTVGGLTRGSGIGTTGSGAARGWGGNGVTSSTAAAAITANQFATFTVGANSGYQVSFSSFSKFDYRRSGTGATNALVQYQLGSGSFTDIATVAYSNSTSSGASLTVDLSTVAALQNISSGTTVTFRVVPYGGTGATGTWYFFDVSNTTANDLELSGTVAAIGGTPTITGAATATAFTTTYGTASAAQTFSISGSGLSADITATAPTGFQVSSDGTTFGSSATFTQSGGSASGSLRLRLAATATVGGSYNAQNVTLVSTGATTINITTAASGNTVSAKGLTISGLSGVDKAYDGTTTATLGGTAAYAGLVNSESFPTVQGTPTASFATASVGSAKAVTVTGYTAPSANYTLSSQPTGLTASITAAPLTIAANNVTKAAGTTITGGAGSTAFTSSGLVNSEVINTVTIAYGNGAADTDAATTYTGQVTASAPMGSNGFSASNYNITFSPGDIIVTNTPTITTSGTPAAANSVYGSPSGTPGTFSVSATSLTADLVITAPSGFEISSSASYSSTVTLTPSTGVVSATTISVRLAATDSVGSYSGNITLTSTDATTKTVATTLSTVSPKPLMVSGVTASDKEYDRTTTAGLTGTPDVVGVLSADSGNVTVSGTPAAVFASATVGTAKTVSVTGYTLSGSAAGNYSLTLPATLSAAITAKALTVSGAAVTTKIFDGTAAATVTGTLNGVISPDVVNFVGTGTFASTGPGTAIGVTSTSTITGADAGNYSLTQPTGLTGNITGNTNANLSNLTISSGTLSPAFSANTITYTDKVATTLTSITVTPTVAQANATIKVNGTTVNSGSASGSITVNVGSNAIAVEVTAQDGTTKKTYTVTVNRPGPITIFHTNDTHARVTPHKWVVPHHTTDTNIEFDDVGGVAYMGSKILSLTAAQPDSLVLDGGDISEGNPIGDWNGTGFNLGTYGDGTIVEYYKMLNNKLKNVAGRGGRGLDAMVVGNHDIRDITYLNNMKAASAEFPILSINICNKGTHTPYYQGTTTITLSGHKIGIIGYTTESADSPEASINSTIDVVKCDWSSTDSTKIHFADYVNDLRNNQGCDLVILLTHMGHSGLCTPTGANPTPILVDNSVGKLPEIVVSGHWHTYCDSVWEPTSLNYKTIFTEAGSFQHYVGELRVDAAGKYTSATYYPLKVSEITPDSDIAAFIQQRKVDYEVQRQADLAAGVPGAPTYGVDDIVGYTADNLLLDNYMKWWSADEYPWSGNNTAGNWICDAVQWKAAQLFSSTGGCDLSIEAGGGVRSDIIAGPIKYTNIYETFPWPDDTIYVVNMTGQEIYDYFKGHGCDAAMSNNWHVNAYDGVPTLITFNGSPIDLAHTYKVAINNYMFAHDSVPFSDPTPQTSTYLARTALIDYTAQFDSAHPYHAGSPRYTLNTDFSGGYRFVVTMMNDKDSREAFEDGFIRMLDATSETLAHRGTNQVPNDLIDANGKANPANRLTENEWYRSYLGFRDNVVKPGDIVEIWGKGAFFGGNPEFVDQEGVQSDGVEFKIVGHDDSLAKPTYFSSISGFWDDWHKNHYVKFFAKKSGTNTVTDRAGNTISIQDVTAYASKTLPGVVGDLLVLTGVPTSESFGLRFRCDTVALASTQGVTSFPPDSAINALAGQSSVASITLSATANVAPGSDRNIFTLGPVADSQVAKGKPTTNSGTATSMFVQSAATGTFQDERAWLKFDLSTIPSGSTITSAKLKMYCWKALGSSMPAGIYLGTPDSWTETGINWNNQPTFGSAIDTQTLAAGATNVWYTWNATNVQSDFASGKTSFSYVVKPVTEGSTDTTSPSYAFEAREYTSGTPYLEVITPATGTPVTVAQVQFFYRFSTDGTTWGSWTSAGTVSSTPYTQSFTYPQGVGYYEFYSVATDSAGATEPTPPFADASTQFLGGPSIVVEQPTGTGLTSGTSTVDFGSVGTTANATRVFTIKNLGSADLTGLAVTIDGTDSADFSVTATAVSPVTGPSGSTTFTVRFAPSTAGAKTAALHIASNDATTASFSVALTGTAVSSNADLAGINLNGSGLAGFSSSTYTYNITVPGSQSSLAISPSGAGGSSTITVNGSPLVGGSATISLNVGATTITVVVTAQDGSTMKTYVINVTRPFNLQLLHYYGESGILGNTTAPIMGALIERFRSQYANTVSVAEGDDYIPGPWLVGGADPSLNSVSGIGSTALGRPDIAILNAFGTTVSALGNHEFDLGSPVFASAIGAASPWVGAQFPFITDNLNFSGDSSLKGLADKTIGGTSTNSYAGSETTAIKGKIAPYAVKTINGEKIGFVGSTTFELLSKTSPNGTVPYDDNPNAVDANDIQEVAAKIQGAVDALTALGVNKIIEVDQLDDITRTQAVAALVSGVDIWVAGGGHERLIDSNDTLAGFNGHSASAYSSSSYPVATTGADGQPSLVVTTDTEFTYLGRLVVDFDSNGHLITSSLNNSINGAYASTEATLQAAYGTTQTASQIVAGSTIGTQVKAITNAINSVVVSKDTNIFGYTNVYLEGDRVFGRTQEVNLGDITADANLAKAKSALGFNPVGSAVFSLKNGGGLRASVGEIDEDTFAKVAPTANATTGKPAGAVTQLDVENSLRFDNKLMVCDFTPAGLLNVLNFAAGLSTGPSNQSGGYPQVGNIRFSYDSSLSSNKVRTVALVDDAGNIVSRLVDNGAVRSDAPTVIKAVVLNFTMNGGDGYPIKANASNFRYLLAAGGLSSAVASSQDFTSTAGYASVGLSAADVLGEQKAFQDYLLSRYSTPAAAYNQADTPVAQDTRIQQLAFRSDTVATGPVYTAPSYQFSADTYSVSEENGPVTLTINRNGDTSYAGTVTLGTADGTASAGTDYTSISSRVVNFAAGDTSKTVNVTIANRHGAATARTFTATLTSPDANSTLGTPVTTTVTITPSASPGAVTFGAATYTVNQGASSIALTVNRSGGSNAFAVTINTANGVASPPFAAAVAGTDYTALSGSATTLNFGVGDLTKTVTITLAPKSTVQPNRQFTATLSGPTNGATLGANATTTAQILANDTTGPTVVVSAPLANAKFITTATTVNLTGTAFDAHGVASVTYTLNSGTPVAATLGATTSSTAGVTVAYSAVLTPSEGTNTLVVTARDLRGNTTNSVSRSFTYHLSSTLTLNRTVPATLNPDDVGNISPVGAVFPTTANLNPKTANVQLNNTVTLIPTTKAGYIFKGFTTTPVVTLTLGIGGRVSFTMVPNLSVTAEWLTSPYVPGAGTYIGLIKARTGTTPSNATDGLVRATITTAGTFSGSLVIDGATHVFTGAFDAVGAAGFGTALPKATTFTITRAGKSDLVLALAFNAAHGNNQITGSVTVDTNVSDLVADKTLYTAINQVSSDFLNVTSGVTPRGYYTVSYPAKAQTPTKATTSYPQGSGYAVITLTNAGAVTVTSTLADGTVSVATSSLVAGNSAPLFGQMLTPGSTTVKGSSFGGVITFEKKTDSDVLGTDLTWYRAQAAITGTAATDLYTTGWPDGVKVDALGAQYDATVDVATALGLSAVDATNGNGKLAFTDGKLTAPGVTKTKFNIAPGTVANSSVATKIPTTDATYTLGLVQGTGLFSGVFAPNWSSPAVAKPLYRGVILQKGGNKGGYGFFLSNATGDADPESGKVLLSKQP